MASITIRDLPDQTKEALRVSAARSGLSLEAYARHILQKASCSSAFEPVNILTLADKCFGSKQGVDLDIPARSSSRKNVRELDSQSMPLM